MHASKFGDMMLDDFFFLVSTQTNLLLPFWSQASFLSLLIRSALF